jgi:toxin ParE1/3/4
LKHIRTAARADKALQDIFEWTAERFGPAKAISYAADIKKIVRAIAKGEIAGRPCRDMLAPDAAKSLKFARSGRHFIIFTETTHQIAVLDILHQSSDLARRLAALDQGPA